MILRYLAAGLLALCSTQAFAAEALPKALNSELLGILQGSSVRGAAVVLIEPEQPLKLLTYGESGHGPIDANSCFRAGSVSKTFTALLATRLAEQGRFDLQTPLPEALQPRTEQQCAAAVNAAQLLEHTAGLAGSSHADYGRQLASASASALAPEVLQQPLRWCPGQHFSYANDGYLLVAAALEQAIGESFDQLMRTQVFEPLGMGSATFATANMPACLSASYSASGEPIEPWLLASRPAGGLIVRPLELAALARLLLEDGKPLLQGATLARMGEGRTGLAAQAGLSQSAYGLGLFHFMAGGGLLTGHWGRIDGFQTTLGVSPETGRGMVIMLNTADRHAMHRLRETLAVYILQDLTRPASPPAVAGNPRAAGWYANYSHEMPLRAPWVALFDLRIVTPTAAGVEATSAWPWGASRQLAGETPNRFREANLPLATAAFWSDAQGDWWLEGESYRRVEPWSALLQMGTLLVGLSAALGALLRGAWVLLRPAQGSRGGDLWLALAAASLLFTLGGYAWWGLFDGWNQLAALGRISPASLSLLLASLLAPLALASALWCWRGTRIGWWRALLGLGLAALLVLLLSYGWLPLITWRV